MNGLLGLAPPPPPSPLPGGKSGIPRAAANMPTKKAAGPLSEAPEVQVALQAVQEQCNMLWRDMALMREALAASQRDYAVQGEALAGLRLEVETLRTAFIGEVDARATLALDMDALRLDIRSRTPLSPPRGAPPPPPLRQGPSVSPLRAHAQDPRAPPTCSEVASLERLVLLAEGKLEGFLGMRLEETVWASSLSTHRNNVSRLRKLSKLVSALGVPGVQQHPLVRAHYTFAGGKIKLAHLADHIDCSGGGAPTISPPHL
jgi:hypothetical protein